MKTTILATAVLIALGFSAHAEEVEFSDTKVEATEAKSATDTSKAKKDDEKVKAEAKAKAEADVKAKEEAKKEADAKAKAKKDAEEKAKADADAKKTAAKSDSKSEDETPRKKIKGFQDNNGVTGDLEVGIVGTDTVLKFTPDSCSSGSCTKLVVFDKKTNEDMNNMKSLRDALGNPPKPVDTVEMPLVVRLVLARVGLLVASGERRDAEILGYCFDFATTRLFFGKNKPTDRVRRLEGFEHEHRTRQRGN